ncbi:hypothetical protein GALMADRAFT_711077 [Galerina marginata CBS 339.88]|uniref:Uncharacterized protein n=1 Tax=Galerina marginata (strain CBS 339.88) TaxID=685588 RepID=A0A067TME0_GALM3|nr:hypothetical protein GALMADRAFT_711077 [Galerina marginata CBS 339.88]
MSEKKRKAEANVYPLFLKKAKPGSKDTSTQTAPKDFHADANLAAFQELLDFSLVNDEAEITRRFDIIPRMLIHEFRLVVKPENKPEVEFQIMEAEFYIQVATCHEDPFTHWSEEQKISGRWYFNRAPKFSKDSHRSLTSSTEYRSGSRKGMDLTLGGSP